MLATSLGCTVDCGNQGYSIVERDDISSSMGPFRYIPDYQIVYPQTVVDALADLYQKYNKAFGSLVAKNREWGTDYQYCFNREGVPVNFGVQFDMIGLPDNFLEMAKNMPVEDVSAVLARHIFEIENSLAMYQLLERLFEVGNTNTFFKRRFRTALDEIRKLFGKPIALLAVTDQKYFAMRESEFGKYNGSPLSDEEVRNLSGFDRFFGPEDFLEHIRERGGECDYLLYVRSSDPVTKLKDPSVAINHPLLSNPDVRRAIKKCALTFNVDGPSMGFDGRINDTKEYMIELGIGFPVRSEEDLYSSELMTHLGKNGAFTDFPEDQPCFTVDFRKFLAEAGINQGDVISGRQHFRLKPLKGTYGCYGHLTGSLANRRLRSDFRKNLRQRTGYIIQPELKTPVISGIVGGPYTYIDRVFMACTDHEPAFLGGFRSLMPVDSAEAKKGRNHGNKLTVWGEIVS